MKESDIQSSIMTAVGGHPNVVWVMVVTTGKFRVKGGFITTGHYMTEHCRTTTGMSDIIGMLDSGAFLAIETKKPGEEPTAEQHEFLRLVEKNGGKSGWCCDVDGALEIVGNNSALTEEIIK